MQTAHDGLEERLADRTWAAGVDCRRADCGAAPGLLHADWCEPIPPSHARLRADRARLLARPSYARALDKSRPYRNLFPLGDPGRD